MSTLWQCLLRLHYRCLNFLYFYFYLLISFSLFCLFSFFILPFFILLVLIFFCLGAVKTEGIAYPTAKLLIIVLAFSTTALDTRHRDGEMFIAQSSSHRFLKHNLVDAVVWIFRHFEQTAAFIFRQTIQFRWMLDLEYNYCVRNPPELRQNGRRKRTCNEPIGYQIFK